MPKIVENIFKHTSYKDFLTKALSEDGAGTRSELAKHLDCQSGYISQVLNAERHFSEEHLIEIAEYFELGPAQSDYLLLLGRYERASTQKLRTYLQGKLDALRLSRQRIPIQSNTALTDLELAQFHSSWHYYAVYMLLQAKKRYDQCEIVKILSLPVEKVQGAYEFLREIGVVKGQDSSLQVQPSIEGVGRNTPYVDLVHKNFRLEALKSFDHRTLQDAHYSRYLLASDKRAAILQEEFAEFIINLRDIVASPDEGEQHLFGFCMDMFRY